MMLVNARRQILLTLSWTCRWIWGRSCENSFQQLHSVGKAKDIIRLVGNENSFQQLHSVGFDSHAPSKPITILSTSMNDLKKVQKKFREFAQLIVVNIIIGYLGKSMIMINSYLFGWFTDLPLHRKQSLQRFLQNRKKYRYIFLDYYCYYYF